MLDVENLEKWEDVHQVKSFCLCGNGRPPVIYQPVLRAVVCEKCE